MSFNDTMIEIIVYLTIDRIEPIELYNKEIRPRISNWTYEVLIGFRETLLSSR